MARQAVFAGLVVDEQGRNVTVVQVGARPHYVVDDAGFLRHIPSEKVDRQVFAAMQELILGNRELVVSGIMDYLKQEDLFTKAAVEHSISRMDEEMEQLLDMGLPEENRQWLGMMGFRVVIDVHGEVVEFSMPGTAEEE